MGMTINTNVSALNAQRNLQKTQNSLQTALQRLSSGLRINSAKDDAAGLAISDRFTAQITGLNQAVRNANDGISMAQTTDGALQAITDNLQRIRELAVQSANGSNTAADRQSIQLEVTQLTSEIDRIAKTTTFNNVHVLDGSAGTTRYQVGANANETISMDGVDARAQSLGSQAGLVQSTGYRVTLEDGALDAGTQGIQEASTGTLTSVSGGQIAVAIGSNTAVSIATAQFGGTITNVAYTSIEDVNGVDYGTGIAKKIADRINTIRTDQITNTNAGESGTFLEGVYASATTTFSVSDLKSGVVTDLRSGASGTSSGSDYTFVGAGSITNGGLKINGVDIGPATFQANDSDGSLTNAINAKSDTTGVQASISDKGELVLTASDGRDISISTSNTATTNLLFAGGGSSANSAQTTSQQFSQDFQHLRITGNVTISANDSINLKSSLEGGEAGFNNDTPGSGSLKEDNVQAVGSIANADVTTVDAANTTINSVDSALNQIDNIRAQLGAVQNRFGSTISNLQSVSENLSASRSRILDTDFATETTAMTKAQILQQAGTAMLAQANTLPQQVLSLLK